MKNIYEEMQNILSRDRVFLNEDMKNHCSFKAGGKSKYFTLPKNLEEIIALIKFLKTENIDYYILAKGSNLLVRDKGYNGCIIKLADNLSSTKVLGNNKIEAEPGISLQKLADLALKNSLKGLEFASGIPGSLGGAITMNAGAYGGETKDIIESVKILDPKDYSVKDISNKDMNFAYRKSIIQDKGLIILSAVLKLEKGDYDEIKALMYELNKRRSDKQPLNLASAGSTFRRPEGFFAGKLIEDSGLKGKKIGGAQVSTKHAGFIVNIDNATAKDICDLIDFCVKTIKEKFGPELKTELKIIGDK